MAIDRSRAAAAAALLTSFHIDLAGGAAAASLRAAKREVEALQAEIAALARELEAELREIEADTARARRWFYFFATASAVAFTYLLASSRRQ